MEKSINKRQYGTNVTLNFKGEDLEIYKQAKEKYPRSIGKVLIRLLKEELRNNSEKNLEIKEFIQATVLVGVNNQKIFKEFENVSAIKIKNNRRIRIYEIENTKIRNRIPKNMHTDLNLDNFYIIKKYSGESQKDVVIRYGNLLYQYWLSLKELEQEKFLEELPSAVFYLIDQT